MTKDKNKQVVLFNEWREKYSKIDEVSPFFDEIKADNVKQETFEEHIKAVRNWDEQKWNEYETIWRSILGFDKK